MNIKKEVSLVLSSGGARGVAHIGVIEELEEQGFEIKSIAGTSMGALVGGMYATGKLDVFKEWMCSLNKMDVINLIDFKFSRNGIIKGDKILREMKQMIPDRNIKDLLIPFVAVATDIGNGREVIFSNGSLYDAIRASISIPAVFTPFKKDDFYLVDGGILNPIPISRIRRFDNDILIVVNVNALTPNIYRNKTDNEKFEQIKSSTTKNSIINKLNNFIPRHKKDKIGYFNLLNKTTSLMLNKISSMTLEKYKPDILINISKTSFGTYDFYKSEKIIELSKRVTNEAINKYKFNYI